MHLEFSPATTDVARLMRTRRTINDFQQALPPVAVVLQAIELASWAPNHKLTEPWRFYLLGPDTARQIIELNTRLTTAEKGAEAARKKQAKWEKIPGWLAVTTQTSPDALRDLENYAAVCCAIQNLSLFLWSQGIGTKWSTGEVTRTEDFARLLNIPSESERVVGLIWYGYPAASPEMHRRPICEVTRLLP